VYNRTWLILKTHYIGWLVFNDTKGYTVTCTWNILCRAKRISRNSKLNREIYNNTLFDLVFVEIISSTLIGVLGGVFPANHLASTDNLTRTTNTQKTKLEYIIQQDIPNRRQYCAMSHKQQCKSTERVNKNYWLVTYKNGNSNLPSVSTNHRINDAARCWSNKTRELLWSCASTVKVQQLLFIVAGLSAM